MPVDKIRVSGDARIQHQSAKVNGRNYGYLLSQPQSGQYRATAFLIHGFPDISMGWRYQIPALVDLGLRVVAPDCLGYGRTDAPDDFVHYSHKRCADDIKALASHLGESKIILGGHDWGAAFAYRIALWHPELVSHLFTVCVPFAPPRADFTPLEDLVRTITPNFAYQLQFASGDLEKVIRSKDEIRQVLCSMYGGRTEDGQAGFEVGKGLLLDRLGKLGHPRLLSEEEMEYYSTEFARNGIHGPLNWYRIRQVNHDEELSILDRRITVPVLFIQALRDQALPPHMGKSMKNHLPQMTLKEVNTSHWALWEKPEEVNAILTEWLKDVAPAGPNQVPGKL
ncbi:Epoxide hydrolase [Penicillium capsulatum]|uniref:Epoxide hydrolase n=1 Tax=Penicillium capsulatum TaxID=69766 RepID=A0A9W9IWM5_9EURO|nr:Epoxide hydrolase [Penicillium capsulatum]KAJ6129090.1 Epoxide hydrolase [Penicillium capsulatum]